MQQRVPEFHPIVNRLHATASSTIVILWHPQNTTYLALSSKWGGGGVGAVRLSSAALAPTPASLAGHPTAKYLQVHHAGSFSVYTATRIRAHWSSNQNGPPAAAFPFYSFGS